MSRQNDRILNLWFVYIMFYICFKHLFLNDTFLYIVMDLLFFIIILKEIVKREAIDDICRRFRIKIRLEWIFFFILISDMFLSTFYAADFFNAIKFFIVYLNFLVIAVWFSYLPGWEAKMYKWMKAGCLFHFIFTEERGEKMEGIVVALIGLAGSAVGSLAGVLASAKLTSYRLEQLEKRVQAHNNLIERTYKLEERTEVQEEKIRVANHRISDLERKDG